jgi:hypothetical protein
LSKSNEKIILPPDFFQLLQYKHLLLDTSFFGDYSSYPEVFFEFVEDCKKNSITLVTNIAVSTEFTRGSDTPSIFIQKTALVKKIIDSFLPINSNIFDIEIPLLTERYGQIGKSISVTDFVLAAQTKLYSNDLCLLTKNPKDFPSSIFTLKTHFLLRLERGLQVYGVYCYQKEKPENESNDQERELEAPF